MVCDKRSATVLKEEQLPVELLMLCVNVMKFVNFMHRTIFSFRYNAYFDKYLFSYFSAQFSVHEMTVGMCCSCVFTAYTLFCYYYSGLQCSWCACLCLQWYIWHTIKQWFTAWFGKFAFVWHTLENMSVCDGSLTCSRLCTYNGPQWDITLWHRHVHCQICNRTKTVLPVSCCIIVLITSSYSNFLSPATSFL